jgi:pyruvate/2-oxoglutarate dehydrogenase complex dihydrolipoamide dehydrogenase (E3) component
MSDSEHSKVLILGSGPAGCTAAIYAARAMMEPLMVAGIQPGGQLTITTEVENYPGFHEAVQGPWLMEQMQAQAEHLGTRVAYDLISSADLARRPFVFLGDSGKRYTADSVIIATGAEHSNPGVKGHEPDMVKGKRDAAAVTAAADRLRAVVPDAGAYANESNYFDRTFQKSYWGPNYPRLTEIKKKYDPEGLFFVHNGVGSEQWSKDGFERV